MSPGVRPTIVVLDDWEHALRDLIDWAPLRACAEVHVHSDSLRGPALADAVADAHVLVLLRERTPIDASLIATMPALRRIVCTGARNRTLDAAAAEAAGIEVVYTHGGPAKASTCELTWALILAAKHRLSAVALNATHTTWRQSETALPPVLHGKRLGLIGLGEIGQRVAAVGQAFGMEVVTWSPHMTAQRAAAHGAKAVSLETLLSTADIVSLHLVPSPSTHHLLNAERLALIKPDSMLVNVSRAELIDTAALVDALQRRTLGMAALDVFDEEPLVGGHPLLALPNVLLTPHHGFVCKEVMGTFAQDVEQHLRDYLDEAI